MSFEDDLRRRSRALESLEAVDGPATASPLPLCCCSESHLREVGVLPQEIVLAVWRDSRVADGCCGGVDGDINASLLSLIPCEAARAINSGSGVSGEFAGGVEGLANTSLLALIRSEIDRSPFIGSVVL